MPDFHDIDSIEIRYSKYLVCFLDVLGFSDIVQSGQTELIQSIYQKIHGHIDLARVIATNFTQSEPSTMEIASDSVLIAVSVEREALVDKAEILFMDVARLQTNLASVGALIRGGIAYGDLCLDLPKKIAVGPALVEAVQLEKEARFPRVFVSSNLADDISGSKSQRLISTDKFWARDQVTHAYLDYLQIRLSDGLSWQALRPMVEGMMVTLQQRDSKIQRSIILKRRFTSEYCISRFQKYASEYPELSAYTDQLRNLSKDLQRKAAWCPPSFQSPITWK